MKTVIYKQRGINLGRKFLFVAEMFRFMRMIEELKINRAIKDADKRIKKLWKKK